MVKKKQTKQQKIVRLVKTKRPTVLIVALIFAVIGAYLTFNTFAAKPQRTQPLPIGMALTAKVVGPYQVDLSWTPAPGESEDTRYHVHSIGPDGVDRSQPATLVHRQSQVGSKTSGASVYNSSYGVLPGQTVQYYVTSDPYLIAGTQRYRSETITVTTPTPTSNDTAAPTAPTGASVSLPGTMRASVAWSPASDNVGVTAYHIYENGWYSGSVPGDVTSYDLRVIADYYFSYYVVAVDANGNWSAPSASAGIKTPPLPLNGSGKLRGGLKAANDASFGIATISAVDSNGRAVTFAHGGREIRTTYPTYDVGVLPAGSYTFSFASDSYLTEKRSVTLATDQVTTLDITFMTPKTSSKR